MPLLIKSARAIDNFVALTRRTCNPENLDIPMYNSTSLKWTNELVMTESILVPNPSYFTAIFVQYAVRSSRVTHPSVQLRVQVRLPGPTFVMRLCYPALIFAE